MVKHSSHEASNVGSNPAELILYKFMESSQVGKAPVFGTGTRGSSPLTPEAKVVELVYTLGLGSSSFGVRVQVPFLVKI